MVAGAGQGCDRLGELEGVPGDPASRPSAGDAVTVSVRPECWTLSGERAARGTPYAGG